MLHEANFTYDSSMPIYENKVTLMSHSCVPTLVNRALLQPPAFPYTLDHRIFHDCMIPPCPTKVREHQSMALIPGLIKVFMQQAIAISVKS
jgi:hypothetical protein